MAHSLSNIRLRMPIAAAMTALMLITPALAQMKLRDELISRQKNGGYELAGFDHGAVSVADFTRKEGWVQEKLPPPGDTVQDGLLSPDGTMIALTFFHHALDKGVWETLGIVRRDGSGMHEFADLTRGLCWTPDSKRLIVTKRTPPAESGKVLLNLESGSLEEIDLPSLAWLTSQCWSPDGKELAYFVWEHDPLQWNSGNTKKKEPPNWGTLFIYDIAQKERHEIGMGQYPTWSPDGEWIAYWNKNAYYRMRPSGEGRSRLFKYKDPEYPVFWSPDSRLILHFHCCYLWPSLQCMCDVGRWYVKRLADRSEIRVVEESPYVTQYVWIRSRTP